VSEALAAADQPAFAGAAPFRFGVGPDQSLPKLSAVEDMFDQ